MANVAKTVVATGGSSGLGFEVIQQMLAQSQPYKFILGVRNVETTNAALSDLKFDSDKHEMTVLPLELGNLKGSVRPFAREVLSKLGTTKIDYLMLNAAINAPAKMKNKFGSKWCEAYVVNSLSQHYLQHLLKDKLIESKSRIVVVSSGAVTMVPDPSVIEADITGGADTDGMRIYCDTKFTQLLTAQWWRRTFPPHSAVVVATSPGMVPGTGLSRNADVVKMPSGQGISIPQGASNILRAFTVEDFPADSKQIFLTSWGEWWPVEKFSNTLDEELQDKWSPSLAEVEASFD